MTSSAETPSPRDELFRRIGRNVVNFQYLEATLRSMIPALSLGGDLSQLPLRQANRARELEKSSLGNLATAYLKVVFRPPGEIPIDDHVPEPVLAFSVRRESTAEGVATQKRALKSLVAERNRLIHKDLLSVDLDSPEQCDALSARLDDQNTRLRQQVNELNDFRAGLREMAEELKIFLESQEFAKLLQGESADVVDASPDVRREQ
jgi:hypothetical protein